MASVPRATSQGKLTTTTSTMFRSSQTPPRTPPKKKGSSPPRSPGGTATSLNNSMIVTFNQRADEAKTTYGTLRAKGRGERIHMGPLELRKSMAPRDCTSWMVASTHCYTPWEREELLKEKPKRKKSPPKMWLPTSGAEHRAQQKKKQEEDKGKSPAKIAMTKSMSMKSLGKEGAEEKTSPQLHSRAWDCDHHVMHSRRNHEMQSGTREYFGKPIAVEPRPGAGGVPKVTEQWAMNDRQCGYNDDPLPPGEGRRTLFHDIGPYARGGCKEHQMPSWWRKIKDWSSYSTPDLGTADKQIDAKELLLFNARAGPQTKEWITQHNDGKPLKVPGKKPQTILAALADAPPDESTAFWRTWAEKRAQHPSEDHKPYRWDRYLATPSLVNDSTTRNQRYYFSVPAGATGYGMEAPRKREPKRLTDAERRAKEKEENDKAASTASPAPTRRRRNKEDAEWAAHLTA